MALGRRTPVSVQAHLKNVTTRKIAKITGPKGVKYLSQGGSDVGWKS